MASIRHLLPMPRVFARGGSVNLRRHFSALSKSKQYDFKPKLGTNVFWCAALPETDKHLSNPTATVLSRCYSRFITEKYQKMYALESWSHTVHPFGKLTVDAPFNVKVFPLDPHEYPNQDRAFLTLYADREKGQELIDVISWNQFLKCHVDIKDSDKEIILNGNITEDGHSQFSGIVPVECLIQIPMKFALDLNVLEHGNVDVENMECHDIRVKTQKGDTFLRNLKCGNVSVHTWGGNITCRNTLYGNIELKAGNQGSIDADKFQGQQIKVMADCGNIRAKSVYADDANFWTQTGNICLGSCHGNLVVDVQSGEVGIESVDGNLRAVVNDGDLSAYLTRHETVSIKIGKGDIHLDLAENSNTHLTLMGSEIHIDPAFTLGDVSESKVNALTKLSSTLNWSGINKLSAETASGQIALRAKDWFSNLNLGRKEK